MEKCKVILTWVDCDTIPRKGHVGFGKPHVYLKPLNRI